MRAAARLNVDPLWECLCPAWNSTISQVNRTAALKAVTRPRPLSTRIKAVQCRALSITTPRRSFGRAFETSFLRPLDVDPYLGRRPTQPETSNVLYKNIEEFARRGNPDACRTEVQELVRRHGIPPDIRMYNALILSNISPDRGAAWRVQKLLKEMEDENIELDQGTCHNVLKVLAVHPDHLLCSDIQSYMREKWFSISPEGHHDITVSLLRDGCFEMALNNLDTMARENVHPEPWLLDMFTYMLSEADEIDLVYRMVRSRWRDSARDISSTLWFWLLDMASAARHYPLTEFVWRTHVDLDFVQASSGMCYNIMSTASRAGDPTLVTDVFKYIARRGEKNTALHYQLLIDAYMAQEVPDIEKALTVLCVMSVEKVQTTKWQTRSLFVHLKDSQKLVESAFDILQRLRDAGKDVPVAAVNLIIECYAHQQELDEAMKVYKQMHTFEQNSSKTFANTETFNELLKSCRTGTDMDAKQAGFLISEMLAVRVQPDVLTYDRLILVFSAVAGRGIDPAPGKGKDDEKREYQLALQYIDIACQYFSELQSLNWRPRWTTLSQLAMCLAQTGDARCWDLLQYADETAVSGDGWEQKARSKRMAVKNAWKQFNSGLLRSEEK